jgi:gp32 DNA binding protein like
MSIFEKVKSSRANVIAAAQAAASEASSSGNGGSYWTPTKKADGSASAIIRFLPDADGGAPFVWYYSHFVKGVYTENCRSTLGEADPMHQYANWLWNNGGSEKGTEARKRYDLVKRKKNFVSNILVVKDPAKPENNGRVFLWNFGAQIFSRLEAAFKGDELNDPFDPSDPEFGQNLKVIVKTAANGIPNYEQSSWERASPLAETDEDIEAILQECKPLTDFKSPSKFKPYDTLKELVVKGFYESSQAF